MTTEELERGLWDDDGPSYGEYEEQYGLVNDPPAPDAIVVAPKPTVPIVGSSIPASGTPVQLPTRTLADDPYTGVAALPFDERAQITLAKYQTVDDEWIDIRPEGLIYLSHIKARRILNEAFGYGGWAIVPVGEFRREEKGNQVILYRTYRLYVNGRYAGEVEASGEYWSNNRAQNYADAAEACQSYALNRLSKNFGIASQCWDKAYGEEWKRKYAEKDGEGKWRKRLVASSPQGETREQISRTPEVRTEPADPSTSPSPASTAPPNKPRNQSAVIQIASMGKGWLYGNTPNQMCKDTQGKSWKLVGAGVIETARVSLEDPLEPKSIRVEYIKEQTPKGIVSAVVDAQIEEGGNSA